MGMTPIRRAAWLAHAAMPAHRATARKSIDLIASQGASYAVSVSWGKDSVALLHLAAQALGHVTAIHGRYSPNEELPDIPAVRDAVLPRWGDMAYQLALLGSFALIGSAVCSLVFSLRTTLTMILSVFLAVGAACLLYATTALRRKVEFPGVALLVPVCAMVLALILFYREHAADPILRHYYVETLALAALTVLLLEFAAFAFRGGAPRLLMPASTMSVILCAAALAACPTLAEILFYAGGACIALGIGAAADFDP
jgi:lysylphosphatidylglycerol synthetase-like protein (DUF2156 family)